MNMKTMQHIDQVAAQLLEALVACGTTFYSYCGQQIMYRDRWLTDMYSKAGILSALDQHLGVSGLRYANEVALSIRCQSKALCVAVPEGKLGTVGGVKEPKLKMTKFLSTPVAMWLRKVIEKGILN